MNRNRALILFAMSVLFIVNGSVMSLVAGNSIVQEMPVTEGEGSKKSLISPDDAVVSAANEVKNVPVDPQKEKEKAAAERKLIIRFEDESLVDVINFIAGQKGANVLLPMGDKEIKSKVTIRFEEKFTIDEAWDFLQTLLNLAGYSMVPRGDMFAVLKGSNPVKEPLPLYISVNYEDLPETDEYIRCLFYLKNVKITDDTANVFNSLLSALMPAEANNGSGGGPIAKFAVDPVANALIIADRSRVVKSVMRIVTQLERTEFKEKYEIVNLMHTSSDDVAKLFNETILKAAQDRYPLVGTRKPSETNYFSRNVRIISENRLNVLLVFGREQAVDRVRDFIKTYIDVAPESGKSILHIYQLRYMDAATFSPVLREILKVETEGAAGQARVAAGASSIERYFEGPPIVLDDMPQQQQQTTGAETAGSAPTPQFFGGNNLIIAARNDDWPKIKKLIEELDKPQPQVVIEVLVADLTLEDTRLLGTLLRNPSYVPLPRELEFQSGQVGGVVVNNLDDPKTVALYPADPTSAQNANVIRNSFAADGTPATTEATATTNVANNINISPAGTTVISLADQDNKVFGIMQVYKLFSHRKVISYPHVIAINNRQAKILIGQSRLVPDETTSGAGGAATQVNYKWIDANLEINITPRISVSESSDMFDDKVQLAVTVTIQDFNNTTDYASANKYSREVQTTALLRSGEVLPLGGLLRMDTTDSASQVPLLGKIPLIGYFFKKRKSDVVKTNLTVFLCPTVIRPTFKWGADPITKQYVKLMDQYSHEGALFESLKDPITRWYFKSDASAADILDDFVQQDESKRFDSTISARKNAQNDQGQQELVTEPATQLAAEDMQNVEDDIKSVAGSQYPKISSSLDDKEEVLKAMLAPIDNPLAALIPG